jgi:NADH:ubiquinone oxidoreductase subunit 5 (subunit L)/multisubunit Na+/H+ antiporter MnhA subunit
MLNLPWIHHDSLAGFLSPTFGYVAPIAAASTFAQWGLAVVDFAAAVIGLMAAFTIWRGISESKRYESSFFEHVWHWDDFYDATIGRPLEKTAAFSDTVIEDKVIDGGVMGLAVGVRRSAEGVRKLQSGFVRHYALATVLGVAVIVVYLVARVG